MLLANIPLNGMFDGIELGVVGYSSNSVVRILPSYIPTPKRRILSHCFSLVLANCY